MSGVEIALGAAPIVFKAVSQGWRILDDTISFSDDTEDAIIRLETIKAHLSIWAERAGLTDGELIPVFHPFNELIVKTLRRIEALIADVERKGKDYGIAIKDASDGETRTTATTVVQLRRSLQNVLNGRKSTTSLVTLIQGEGLKNEDERPSETPVPKRIYWAIRDKKKFDHFVDMLEKHVNGLQRFIPESQRKQVQQTGTRFSLQIVQSLSSIEPLAQLQSSSGWDQVFSDIDVAALAQWKAITLQRAASPIRSQSEIEDWSISGVSATDRSRTRFLKRGRIDPGNGYLFEKKEYDPNLSDDDKDLLLERVRKLVSLLSGVSVQRYLQTLQAVGRVEDTDYHCWWIVFRFPLSPVGPIELTGSEPLSLRRLYSSPLKPALESRYQLAKRVVNTFARLYGSSWMHKSINSNNIIFPQVLSEDSLKSFHSVNTALIQGFGYSRQHTEAQTIDRGKVLHELEAAIYRHPNYQGEAASGYQIHYDIYSLGLVLLEIALWGPLMDFLAAKYKPGKEPPVMLSTAMPCFHEIEARELKRRVNIRVERELAYRVGTKYKEVVEWCLNLEGPVSAIDFYNTVAVPLDDLASQP